MSDEENKPKSEAPEAAQSSTSGISPKRIREIRESVEEMKKRDAERDPELGQRSADEAVEADRKQAEFLRSLVHLDSRKNNCGREK